MKKILIVSILLFSFALTGVGVAQEMQAIDSCELVREVTYDGIRVPENTTVSPSDNHCMWTGSAPDQQTKCREAWAIICFINTINRITQIAFALIMAIVVILVLAGGFFILTGGANEENVGKGKKFITYAIIGAIVAMFAYVVPGIISLIVG